MALWLKQSTAVNIKLGQFVDKTDGVTPETALSFTAKVSKNGGALAARNSATAIAHDADGYYTVELDATDTNTLGRLRVTATDSSNALGVWQDFMVVPANVYDSLVGGSDKLDVNVEEWNATSVPAEHTAGYPIVTIKDGTGTGEIDTASGVVQANVVQISGDSVAADNAEAFFDGTGYAGTGNTMPTVTSVTNTVNANVTQISGDSTAADNAEAFFDGTGYAGTNNVIPSVTTVTGNVNGNVGGNVSGSVGSVSGNVGGNVVGSVGSVSGNVGGNVSGSVGSVATGGIAAASFAAGAINAAALNSDAVTEIWGKVCESEGSYTAQQILSIILSALAGVTSSGGDVLETPNGNATRITATLDGSGNRTAMTLNPSS